MFRRFGALALLVTVLPVLDVGAQPRQVDFEALPYAPRHVVCYRTPAPLTIDGTLSEPAWAAVEWSAPFVDIDGVRPVRHATRVKLLWDDTALYIAARLDEPDLWATLTQRDAVIFNDHDFEVFLDPDGDKWRLNFSRVQWTLDVEDGAYRRRLDPATGRRLPEDNWVWSPQGAIDMHMPERWGLLQFTDAAAGTRVVPFAEDRDDRVRWALRRLYYRQRTHHRTHGRYASDLAALRAQDVTVAGLRFEPVLTVTPSMYEITAPGFNGATLHIRQDGRTWTTRPRR